MSRVVETFLLFAHRHDMTGDITGCSQSNFVPGSSKHDYYSSFPPCLPRAVLEGDGDI